VAEQLILFGGPVPFTFQFSGNNQAVQLTSADFFDDLGLIAEEHIHPYWILNSSQPTCRCCSPIICRLFLKIWRQTAQSANKLKL
jgi:hypothetical protein